MTFSIQSNPLPLHSTHCKQHTVVHSDLSLDNLPNPILHNKRLAGDIYKAALGDKHAVFEVFVAVVAGLVERA